MDNTEEKLEQEYQDSLNPDESGELNTTDDDTDAGDDSITEPLSEEQIAELVKERDTLKATNAKLYARAKKAEEALKGRKNAETKIESDSSEDSWKEKIEFLIKHKDFDEEQIDILSSFAKGKGISLEEAFKDKLVSKVIEEDQKAKRIANATPEGKSKSPQFKTIQQRIAEATNREDHKKLWQELSQGNLKGVESE